MPYSSLPNFILSLIKNISGKIDKEYLKHVKSLNNISINELIDEIEELSKKYKILFIFDQFEDFFTSQVDQNIFFEFIQKITSPKIDSRIIFSIRRDYISYFLNLNLKYQTRLEYPDFFRNSLDNEYLHYVGYFLKDEIDSILKELLNRYISYSNKLEKHYEKILNIFSSNREIKPIILQIIGLSLENILREERGLSQFIDTINIFDSHFKLKQLWISEIIQDCGEENKILVSLILYLLNWKKDTCSVKTKAEIKWEITNIIEYKKRSNEQISNSILSFLDSSLTILSKSRLLTCSPSIDSQFDRYELSYPEFSDDISSLVSPKLTSVFGDDINFIRNIITYNGIKQHISNESVQKEYARSKKIAIAGISGLVSLSLKLLENQKYLDALIIALRSALLISNSQDLFEVTETNILTDNDLRKIFSNLRLQVLNILSMVIFDIRLHNYRTLKFVGNVDCIGFNPNNFCALVIGLSRNDTNIKEYFLGTYSLNNSNEKIKKIGNQYSSITHICVSENSKKIVTANQNGEVFLYSNSGNFKDTLISCQSVVKGLCMSMDGSKIVCLVQDSIHVFKGRKPFLQKTISNSDEMISNICLLPHIDHLAIAYLSCSEIKFEHLGQDELSSKGISLNSALKDKVNKYIKSLSMASQVNPKLHLHITDNHLCIGADKCSVICFSIEDTNIFDENTNIKISTLNIDNRNTISNLSFDKDNQILAAFCVSDQTVRMWKKGISTLKRGSNFGRVTDITYFSNCKEGIYTIAVSHSLGDIQFFKYQNYTLKNISSCSGKLNTETSVSSLSFTSDGQLLAALNDDLEYNAYIKILSLPNPLTSQIREVSGKQHVTCSLPNQTIHRIRSLFNNSLFIGIDDNYLILWEKVEDKINKIEHQKLNGISSDIALSSDNKKIATTVDSKIILWDLIDLRISRLASLSAPSDCNFSLDTIFTTVSFSLSGKWLAASFDKWICLWNINENQDQPIAFVAHSEKIHCLCFNPVEDSILASASEDGSIKFWNVSHLDDYQPCLKLVNNNVSVSWISFSPDGKSIASGDVEGELSIWNLDLEHLLYVGVDWAQGYIKYTPNIEDHDRRELLRCLKSNDGLV